MARDFSSFLGRGWAFPVAVDHHTGRMRTSEEEVDIQEAIRIILMTRKGERVMRPDFGCDIHDHQFDVVDYTLLKQMENKVMQALVRWEPRITDVEITAKEAPEREGLILIEIGYVVRKTNNPFNLVYPFYITEGQL